MAAEIEKVRARLLGRVDPGAVRICAYILVLCVLATTRLLGGSWLAVFAGTILVAAAAYLLPVNAPGEGFRSKAVSLFIKIQSLPRSVRVACVVLAFAALGFADHAFGGFALGRGLNLFLLPIFLASLFFGLRIGVLAWLLGILASDYFVIPPDNSFAIYDLTDFADLFVYLYLGIFVLAIPALLRASADLK